MPIDVNVNVLVYEVITVYIQRLLPRLLLPAGRGPRGGVLLCQRRQRSRGAHQQGHLSRGQYSTGSSIENSVQYRVYPKDIYWLSMNAVFKLFHNIRDFVIAL